MNPRQPLKSRLRREIRERLGTKSIGQLAEQSAEICSQLLGMPELAKNQPILAFASLPDEPNLDALWRAELDLALPQVSGENLEIWRVFDPDTLKPGAFGIREPDPESCEQLEIGEIPVILVPGVAFDPKTGMRLGRGGGFYDRLLTKSDATTIGVCFREQLVESVPTEAHDLPVNIVVSA